MTVWRPGMTTRSGVPTPSPDFHDPAENSTILSGLQTIRPGISATRPELSTTRPGLRRPVRDFRRPVRDFDGPSGTSTTRPELSTTRPGLRRPVQDFRRPVRGFRRPVRPRDDPSRTSRGPRPDSRCPSGGRSNERRSPAPRAVSRTIDHPRRRALAIATTRWANRRAAAEAGNGPRRRQSRRLGECSHRHAS